MRGRESTEVTKSHTHTPHIFVLCLQTVPADLRNNVPAHPQEYFQPSSQITEVIALLFCTHLTATHFPTERRKSTPARLTIYCACPGNGLRPTTGTGFRSTVEGGEGVMMTSGIGLCASRLVFVCCSAAVWLVGLVGAGLAGSGNSAAAGAGLAGRGKFAEPGAGLPGSGKLAAMSETEALAGFAICSAGGGPCCILAC